MCVRARDARRVACACDPHLLAVFFNRGGHLALVAHVEDHRGGKLVEHRALSALEHALALPRRHRRRREEGDAHKGCFQIPARRRRCRLRARRRHADVLLLLLLARLTLRRQAAHRDATIAATLLLRGRKGRRRRNGSVERLTLCGGAAQRNGEAWSRLEPQRGRVPGGGRKAGAQWQEREAQGDESSPNHEVHATQPDRGRDLRRAPALAGLGSAGGRSAAEIEYYRPTERATAALSIVEIYFIRAAHQ